MRRWVIDKHGRDSLRVEKIPVPRPKYKAKCLCVCWLFLSTLVI